MNNQKVVTVFGATGFIGRHVVRLLAEAGYTVRAVTRNPQKAYFLRVYGDIGQIVPMDGNMDDPGSIDAAVRGADAVVFLPGVLHANGKRGFERVHRLYPAQVAEACMRHKVRRFVHISALACDLGTSRYAQSKRAGEQAVLSAYPQAVILRPSIVFGAEDGFFARFAGLAKVLPFLPLIGGGKTKFQPVFVGDVADAVMSAITLPSGASISPEGRIYELGGPEVYTFKELMEKIFAHTGNRRALVPVPFLIAGIQGAVLEHLPGAMLTRDQVESLKTDNVLTGALPGLRDLGIAPISLDTVLPHAMARFRDGSPVSKKKKVAA